MIEAASHPAESLEFLSRLHDGELEPSEAAGFESHRAACAECRAAVVEFERALAAYRAAPVSPVASDLSARILRKIQATAPSRRPFGVSFGIDLRWAGILAAALLVLIIGAPVFSRRPHPRPAIVPPPSEPLTAHVVEAPEPHLAEEAPPGAPSARLRAAPKSVAPAAPPKARPAERRDPPADASAGALADHENAAAPVQAAQGAPAPAATVRGEAPLMDTFAKRESPSLQVRRQSASAPAGGEAGTSGLSEAQAPVHLTILAIDGEGSAPGLARAPADERLAPFRGEEFVLVVETGGRVRGVEKSARETKLSRDKAAAREGVPSSAETADVVLKELVFQPGDRSRRLTVTIE